MISRIDGAEGGHVQLAGRANDMVLYVENGESGSAIKMNLAHVILLHMALEEMLENHKKLYGRLK